MLETYDDLVVSLKSNDFFYQTCAWPFLATCAIWFFVDLVNYVIKGGSGCEWRKLHKINYWLSLQFLKLNLRSNKLLLLKKKKIELILVYKIKSVVASQIEWEITFWNVKLNAIISINGTTNLGTFEK